MDTQALITATQALITATNEQYLTFVPVSNTFSIKIQNIIEGKHCELENIVASLSCLRVS